MMVDAVALHPLVEEVSELDSLLGESRRHVDHPFEHEGVESVTRPRIVRPQREVGEHRHAELVGLLDGILEGEVVVRALSDLDPVEDEFAPRAGAEVGGAGGEPETGVGERGGGHGQLR